MKALFEKIRKILKSRKTRQLLTRTVSGIAAVVVFVTTYALVLPAITLEQEAFCGIQEHQHIDECYEESLVCDIPESEDHHHDSSCYEKLLICEKEVHVHSPECYQKDSSAVVSSGSGAAASTALGAFAEPDAYETYGSEYAAGPAVTDSAAASESLLEEPAEEDLVSGQTGTEGSDEAELVSGSLAAEGKESDEDGDVPEIITETVPENISEAVPDDSDNSGSGLADTKQESSAGGSSAGESPSGAGESDLTEDYSRDAAGTEEAANSATTNVLPEPVETEKLSSGYVPQLDSIELGSALNKHTDFFYFHPEQGQEIPETSAEVTDWKKVKNGFFGSTKLESTDLVKMYLSYTIPAGALNETNQVARYRLPSNIHLTDEQIIAINETENGMSALYADAASDTGESAQDEYEDENAVNYQKYLGAEAIEGTRTPDEKLKEGAQEYISAIVKAENVFDEEGIYGEKGAFLGQDLIFIFTPYSIEKNQTVYNADGDPLSAGEKITGWFACDFNMSQIDWVEEDTDLDNSTVEKTAEVVFVEEDSETNVKEISRTLKLVDVTEGQRDAANGGDTTAVGETAAAAATEIAETAATASETASTDETAHASTGNTSEKAVPEDAEDGSFKSGTLTADGDGYRITLDYTKEAKIPENAELSVREITAETDREAYEACLEQAGQQVAADEKTGVDRKASRFFDIEILVKDTDGEGKEKTRKIEPSAPVSVNIQIIDDQAAEDSGSEDSGFEDKKTSQSDPTVLHFAEEGVEQIDATVKDSWEQKTEGGEVKGTGNEPEPAGPATEISFEAESFSIYGVVYTVDFHWEVDGKEYEFSIPGGGFVSLEHLVEVIGIASTDASAGENAENGVENAENGTENDDDFVGEVPGVEESGENSTAYEEAIKLNEAEVSEATKKFVADVESVEFSNPELVWVGKIEDETTVGEIKEEKGLEVKYSAELTEEQIAEINAQTAKAGDWALISLKAFDTEENLTVTMKNGDIWIVKVTDAQLSDDADATIQDGHRYVIYYFDLADSKYYALKGDGSVEVLDVSGGLNNKLNSLGDEYLWNFEYIPDNRSWNVYSDLNLFLTLDSIRAANGTVVNTNPTQNGIDFEYDAATASQWEEWAGVKNWGWVVSDATTNANKYYLTPVFGQKKMVAQSFGLYDDRDAFVALFDQTERRLNFTVKTEYNNTYRGTVGGKDFTSYVRDSDKGYSHANDVSARDHLASYISITTQGNNTAKNQFEITAEAGIGYRFEYWKLDDQIVDSSLVKQRQVGEKTEYYIEAETLTIEKESQVLTAVFSKIPNSELGVPDYADLINSWREDQVNDPLVAEKTAEVYDYDNRIFQVDITASGNKKIIQPDIELSFVTDISRSMYFPSAFTKVGDYTNRTTLIQKLNTLRSDEIAETESADGDSVYYVIGNPDSDATVYALRYYNNAWRWMDASYDTLVHDKNASRSWDQASTVGNGNDLTLNGKTLNKEIYVAQDAVYRLEYLQQAVDIASEIIYLVNEDARIGLVTFAAEARDKGLFTKGQYSQLISALNGVSPTGSTDQLLGLQESYAAFGRNQETGEDGEAVPKKRIVIMITDGAPNNKQKTSPGYWDWNGYEWVWIPEHTTGNPNLNWRNIIDEARHIENDYDATVYTIGLAVNGIKGKDPDTNETVEIYKLLEKTASERLVPVGDSTRYSFNAPTGRALVQAILDIVEDLITPVDIYGEITDTVDPAFYPVNEDGTPVTAGYYKYKEDGTAEPMDPSEITAFDANLTPYYQWTQRGESWIVTWYNVEYNKATQDENDNIVPGVHKSFLIKAKEDFLGGNTINTNSTKARAIADYYKEHLEPGQTKPEEDLAKGKLKTPITREMETPYVNIDELEMNDQSNTWTVYLGTNVDPYTQLKEMYDNILIREVVTQSKSLVHQLGITWASSQVVDYEENNPARQGTTIYEIQKGAWQDDDATLKGLPPSTFTLASVVNTIQKSNYKDTLFSRLVNGEEVVLKYYGDPAYGHGTVNDPVGTITLKLEKTIAPGEGSIPNVHDTAVTNEEYGNKPVESYSLSVVYSPTAPKNIEYHTGRYVTPENPDKHPGDATDQMTSSNTHVINVFEKKLQIEKRDKDTGALIKDYPATFTLYKSTNETVPTKASDIIADNGSPNPGYTAVASLVTKVTGTDDAKGKTDIYKIAPLTFGMYANDSDKTTTYYLVETEQPEGYGKSTAVWPVTLNISETPTNEAGAAAVASALPYDWTQTAILTVGDQTSANDSNTATITFSVDNEKGVDIEILKVDEKGEPLDLATFRLQKEEGSYQDIKKIKVSNDSDELKYPSVGGLDENSSFVSGTEKVKITKLPDGNYKLVEDSTHDGYIIKQKDIEFTISSGVISGTDIEGTVKFEEADETTLALITITNETGAALPNTGGPGTTVFYLLGIMLTAFAGAGLAMQKRRRDAA